MKTIFFNILNAWPGDSFLYWIWGLNILMVFGIIGAWVVKYSKKRGGDKVWAKRLRLVGIVAVTLFTSWIALLQFGATLSSEEDYLNNDPVRIKENSEVQPGVPTLNSLLENQINLALGKWSVQNGYTNYDVLGIKLSQVNGVNVADVDIHAFKSYTQGSGFYIRLNQGVDGSWRVTDADGYWLEGYEQAPLPSPLDRF